MTDLLLDTCTVIWTGNDELIEADAKTAINATRREGGRTYVSPFSAWELGLLVARARLRLERPVENWFEDYVTKGRITLAEASPRILIASSFLPGEPPADPADRIIIATARMLNLCIVTRDRLILDYAHAGHVRALRC
ncbi:MAG: type II toxin-antitoxin system VapC family toxin [Gammaproteobacteria bacterium]|nr:type II toxin-antitoxin system VapC family toxin [Gammaproteobacteria bacterium]MCY4343489.1 type II toxin-antitoxin system VapC family toxin [Gammaproteobacteria bacterium]